MKRKLATALLLFVLLFASFPAAAWAIGPYQPPTLTVVVLGAPKGTEMTVVMHKDGETFHSPIECERRAWESYYRVYRAGVWQIKDWYGNAYDFRDAELVLRCNGEEKHVPLPEGLLHERGFDETITLHYASGKLSYGLPGWRAPLLVGMRVLAALLIEGLFFWLSGYRDRKSWLLFLAINLVIHGALNVFCNGWINVNPDIYMVYYMGMIVSFLIECTAFLLLVDEYDSNRLISYLVRANLASHGANLLLISFLPI